MTPVLRKVTQLNIKCRKNKGHIIDVCTAAPPDEITALHNIVLDGLEVPLETSFFDDSYNTSTKIIFNVVFDVETITFNKVEQVNLCWHQGQHSF